MAFCDNCGHELRSTSKFCGSCGTPAELIEDTPKTRRSKPVPPRRKKSREEELAEYEEEYLSKSKGTRSKSRSKAKPKEDSYEDWSRDWNRRKQERVAAESWKSETATLLCSIFGGLIGLQGIGYFYLGKIGKGIGYLIGSLALFITAIVLITIPSPFIGIGAVCLVAYICMFVWQILDSWRLCRQYNDYYEEFGTRPKW
jgi:hypothetical protein